MYSSQTEYDHLFKILLIGNSGVGKSCMLMRFSENQFTNNFYNTIGVDFKIKSLQIEDKNIKLQIWDTAGQDRFRTITCSYYRGAHGILIVYDITDRESFENIKNWMIEIDKYAQENVTRMLIGNKSDMQDRRQVTYEEGSELAKQYKIDFMECSAKNSLNIDKTFQTIAKNIMLRVGQSGLQKEAKGVKLMDRSQQGNNKSKLNKDSHQSGGCC